MNKNEPATQADLHSARADREPSEKFDIEAYKEFGDYERHFNQMQSICRGFASTWLLATFGGIGYALWNSNFAASVVGPRTAAASLVALAGGTGIFLLWLIDIVVYHRLLVAVTYESSELEERRHFNLREKFTNAAEAPVRVLKIKLFEKEGARKIIAIFYWLPSLFLLVIAFALQFDAWRSEPLVVKASVILWHFVLLICVIVMIFNKNPTKAEITKRPAKSNSSTGQASSQTD
jgi:hypothetical protein